MSACDPLRAATGIEGLDDVLGGGFPAGRLYLLEGEPGSGKTMLALQFLVEGAARGERVLYVPLLETAQELHGIARAHGWSLEGVSIQELANEETTGADGHYTVFHPSEIELTETIRAVFEAVERIQPARVVVDSLSEMRLLARDPLRYKRQVLGLKRDFAGRGCTVLLLDGLTSRSAGLQMASLVHGLVRLEHLATEYGAERRRLRVLKLRGVPFRGGYHDFRIRTGGLTVYPRLVAAEHQNGFERELVTSGVSELDTLAGGGLYRGTSTLVMGPAGCGKSLLGVQYAVAAARRGERAVIYVFDESPGTLLASADGIGTGLGEQVMAGRVLLRQIDPAQFSPGEFACEARRAVERDGARVLVLDSLNGYLGAMPQERFLIAHLHELLSYLRQRGVLVVLVMAQHGLFGSALDRGVDLSYLADAVIVLRYFEAAGVIRRAISMTKKRGGGHEPTIRELRIDGSGLHVGPPVGDVQGVLSGTPVYTGASTPRTA